MTLNQKNADEFDCELFGLIQRAYSMEREDRRWIDVAGALEMARPKVRQMMDAKTRAETS